MSNTIKQDTQIRILDTAITTFSQKGYSAAKVSDICRKAKANQASVNYYFGSKEGLYVEAWKLANKRSFSLYPLKGEVAPDASVEEKFKAFITSLILRRIDKNNMNNSIFSWELNCSTGILFDVIKDEINQLSKITNSFLREMLGADTKDAVIELCKMSILTLCINASMRLREALYKEKSPQLVMSEPLYVEPEVLIQHVYNTSMAMINIYR